MVVEAKYPVFPLNGSRSPFRMNPYFMVGIIGLIALFTVLFLSLFITRLATVALRLTGLSTDAAKFQARSAFTGTGFTTTEAEKVVDHPARRRIILLLMTFRSAGLITIIISLILSFATFEEEVSRMNRLLWLLGGVGLLWYLSSIRWVETWMNRLLEKALRHWTHLEAIDYAGLLNVEGEYSVQKMKLEEGDWLVDQKLEECGLNEEGISVLGIYRKEGGYVGAPKANTEMRAGDLLVVYGRGKRIAELSERKSDFSGETAHEEAVDEQKEREKEQEEEEEERRPSSEEENGNKKDPN